MCIASAVKRSAAMHDFYDRLLPAISGFQTEVRNRDRVMDPWIQLSVLAQLPLYMETIMQFFYSTWPMASTIV